MHCKFAHVLMLEVYLFEIGQVVTLQAIGLDACFKHNTEGNYANNPGNKQPEVQ